MQSVFKPRRTEIEMRVQALAREKGYPLDSAAAQRVMGPRPHSVIPPQGTEIYVSKLPREVFEDRLFPLFETVGEIYKFRLMMSPSGISTRGVAFITFQNEDMANTAIEVFNNMEIVPGHWIEVKKSLDNRRLFIGGIPEEKTKSQVWQELKKVGMRNILEVIMYRSYIDRNCNRGFVFVEFSSHEEAARVRLDYHNAFLFGQRIQIDWSAPLNNVNQEIMKKVKKLFLRNLNVLQERHEFETIVVGVLGSASILEKVYKCRDYAFLHFISRRDAQRGLSLLREYYKNTDVEVVWAKPVTSRANSSNDDSSSSPSGSPNKSNSNHNNGARLRNGPCTVITSNDTADNTISSVFDPNAKPWVPNRIDGSSPPQPRYCAYCSSFLPEAKMFQSSRRIIEALNM